MYFLGLPRSLAPKPKNLRSIGTSTHLPTNGVGEYH